MSPFFLLVRFFCFNDTFGLLDWFLDYLGHFSSICIFWILSTWRHRWSDVSQTEFVELVKVLKGYSGTRKYFSSDSLLSNTSFPPHTSHKKTSQPKKKDPNHGYCFFFLALVCFLLDCSFLGTGIGQRYLSFFVFPWSFWKHCWQSGLESGPTQHTPLSDWNNDWAVVGGIHITKKKKVR